MKIFRGRIWRQILLDGLAPEMEYQVTVTDEKGARILNPRYDVRRLSTVGLAWGQGKAGSGQLALAILCEVFKPDVEMPIAWWSEFYQDVVSALPPTEWVLTEETIGRWLSGRMTQEIERR